MQRARKRQEEMEASISDARSPAGEDGPTSSGQRHSRFSDLATRLESFDYKPIGSQPKEAFMHGPSPKQLSEEVF